MADIFDHENQNRARFLNFLRKNKYYFITFVSGFSAGGLIITLDFFPSFLVSPAHIQMGIYILASSAGISLFKGIFDSAKAKFFPDEEGLLNKELVASDQYEEQ